MKIKLLLISICYLVLSGCSIVAPSYQAQIENVNLLKAVKKDVDVNTVKVDKKKNSISLRGTKLVSPYEESYGRYIETAITEELKKAQLHNPLSPRKLKATIVENDIDATGISTGEGIISVEFVIQEDGKSLFKKTITANSSWESSFMGAIAIQNAQMSYPKLVQQLLENLYKDQDFISSLQ